MFSYIPFLYVLGKPTSLNYYPSSFCTAHIPQQLQLDLLILNCKRTIDVTLDVNFTQQAIYF